MYGDFRNFFFFQKILHHLVVKHRYGLEHIIPALLSLFLKMLRNFLVANVITLFTIKINRFHADEIDHPLKVFFETNGDLHGYRVQTENVPDSLNSFFRIGSHPIEFVDESKPRNLITLHLTIHRDRLRLDSCHPAQNQNGPVQNPQRTFNFNRKINVTGCIDDVDFFVIPIHRCRGRSDRDALLLLQFHVIHGGSTPFSTDFLNFMDLSRVI